MIVFFLRGFNWAGVLEDFFKVDPISPSVPAQFIGVA
jgi:hypothetical protein